METYNNSLGDVLTMVITSYLLDDKSSLSFCLVNRYFSSIFRSGMNLSLFWIKRLEHKLNVEIDTKEKEYINIDWREVYLSTKEPGKERNILLHDNPYLVELALLSGIDPSTNIRGMCDPLYGSCETGNVEVCKLLLECGKYDLLKDQQSGFDLLFTSVDEGHTEIVKMLLGDGRIDPTQRFGSILELSRRKGNRRIVELFSNDEIAQQFLA